MSAEVELKFALDADDLGRLATHPLLAPEGRLADPERLVSIYFDTDDKALRAAGLTLRVREVGGRRVQTVKSADGPGVFGRGEWEAEIGGEAPDLEAVAHTPLAKVLDGNADELRPVFVTRVARRTQVLERDGAEIEASLDEGEVQSGDRRSPLNELELELKSGEPAVLYAVARDLGEAAPLRLSLVSKAEAGYALVGATAEPSKAPPAALGRKSTAAEAFQAIGRVCLHQLGRNIPLLLHHRSPEALHQSRVALRRLRSAITTFEAVVADDQREGVEEGLRWLACELDNARDLDVLIRDLFEPATHREPDRAALAEFGRALLSARTRAYDRALVAIDSPRARRLMLETAAWIETGPWLLDDPGLNSGLRDQPALRFAAEALAHRRKVMKKRAHALAGRDPHARHRLRIAAKKMRYAAEFFAPLYVEGKARRRRDAFIAALKRLQDDLGALNDIAVARRTASLALEPAGGPIASPHAAFAAGVLIGGREAKTRSLVDQAVDAYQAFADAKPFW